MDTNRTFSFYVFIECKESSELIHIPAEHQCTLHCVPLKNAKYVMVLFAGFF